MRYSDLRAPPTVPRKYRRRNPARVSASNRVFARVVDPKPATIFACSRSITRMTPSSRSKCRSRSCRMIPFRLFPRIERLAVVMVRRLLPFANVFLDFRPASRIALIGATAEVAGVAARFANHRYDSFAPPFINGFHDHMAARKIFQQFAEGLAAIERRRHLVGVRTRKLEEHVRADGEDRGPHVGRILIQKLVRGYHARRELAGLREHGLQSAAVRDKILDLIGVQREEFAAAAGEKRVLDLREKQAAERRRLFSKPSFVEVKDDPAAPIHGIDKGRLGEQ